MVSRMRRATGCTLAIVGVLALPQQASAQLIPPTVNITALSDVPFGTFTAATIGTNQSSAQSLCVYSSLTSYTIKATGSGSGGAFTISNGSATLAYTVQWAFSGGQTSGTALSAGTGLKGTPGLLDLLCGLGLLTSHASLIIGLPSANLSAAQAGSYTGTLSLMVSPN